MTAKKEYQHIAKLVDGTNKNISEIFTYRVKELVPEFDEEEGKKELYVCGVLCSCGNYGHREYFLLFKNESEKVKNNVGDCIGLFEEILDTLDGLDYRNRMAFLTPQIAISITEYNNTLRARHNEFISEISNTSHPESKKILTKKILFFAHSLFFSVLFSYFYFLFDKSNLLIFSVLYVYIEICLLKLLSENIVTALSNEWSLDKVEIDGFFDYINRIFKERNSKTDSDRIITKKTSWSNVFFVIIPLGMFIGSIELVIHYL